MAEEESEGNMANEMEPTRVVARTEHFDVLNPEERRSDIITKRLATSPHIFVAEHVFGIWSTDGHT